MGSPVPVAASVVTLTQSMVMTLTPDPFSAAGLIPATPVAVPAPMTLIPDLSAPQAEPARHQLRHTSCGTRPADGDDPNPRPFQPVSYTHLTLPTNREV